MANILQNLECIQNTRYWWISKSRLAIFKSSNAVLSEVVNDLVLTKQPDLLMIEVRVFFFWLVFAAKLFGDFRL